MTNVPEIYNNHVAALNNNIELTNLIINQLRKDFGSLLQDNPKINLNNAYQSIYEWIFPVIQRLWNDDRTRLTGLIYAIDAGFMKKRFKGRKEDEIVQWTHAIILRECLKVYIRVNYKS